MGPKLMGVCSNGRKNIDCFEGVRGQVFYFFFSFLGRSANHNNFFSTEAIALFLFFPV